MGILFRLYFNKFPNTHVNTHTIHNFVNAVKKPPDEPRGASVAWMKTHPDEEMIWYVV